MIREIHITELANELANNNLTNTTANIWDVRDQSSYEEGHIEGAINHPINENIPKKILDDVSGTVYVLCGGGSKAPRAANHLNELDNNRDIVILTGGTRGAKSAGMLIVNSK